MENDGFKICPFCKEKIHKEAVKCRFCGEWLEEISHPKSESNEQHESCLRHPSLNQAEGTEDLVAQMTEKQTISVGDV